MSMGGIELSGMVLKAAPAGEYDRRIVLLTKERGKITAFARSARRMNSPLTAATVPFVFGTFRLYEGRDAYTLTAAEISNYFEGLRIDYIGACVGAYFAEFADYYAQENLEAADLLNLLYASLHVLERGEMPREAIRCAFEVRLMVQNGEFPTGITRDESIGLSARQALYHMITAPLGRLFSFRVTDEVLHELECVMNSIRRRFIDRSFRSLEVLKTLEE